jgi:hypothetical protein
VEQISFAFSPPANHLEKSRPCSESFSSRTSKKAEQTTYHRQTTAFIHQFAGRIPPQNPVFPHFPRFPQKNATKKIKPKIA